MFHDLVEAGRHLADAGGGTGGWITGLIAALGLVIATAITAFAGTFRKHRPEVDTHPLERELRRRAERAETKCERLELEATRLRDILLRWNIDPTSGERVADPV